MFIHLVFREYLKILTLEDIESDLPGQIKAVRLQDLPLEGDDRWKIERRNFECRNIIAIQIVGGTNQR